MKLVKCYIENFGKLSGFSYDFTQGLQVIMQENGFGKTTFAIFIKAMFYGLSGTGKTSVLINERKRYKPWQGGAFGGNLVFEKDGKRYLIERFFGEKDKDETFVLYDDATGMESQDYSSNIGEELFGLDVQAFEYSMFMPQLGLGTAANDSLLSKLTGEAQDEKDMGHYEAAINRLEKEKKELIKIGEKGRIWELRHQITKLECEMEELGQLEINENRYKERLVAVQVELETLEKKRELLVDELETAGSYEKNQAVIRHFQEITQRYRRVQGEFEAVCNCFPKELLGQLPTEEEFALPFEQISQYQEVCQEVSVLEAQMHSLSEGLDEVAKEREQAQQRQQEMSQVFKETDTKSFTMWYVLSGILALVAVGLLFVNVLAGGLLLVVSVALLLVVGKAAKSQQQRIQNEETQREQQLALFKEAYRTVNEKYENKYREWTAVKEQQQQQVEKKAGLQKEIQSFIGKFQPEVLVEEKQYFAVVSQWKQTVLQYESLRVCVEQAEQECKQFELENTTILQMQGGRTEAGVGQDMTPRSLSDIKNEDDACNKRQQQLVEEKSQLLRQLERISQQLEQGQEELAQLEHDRLELQELEQRYDILDKTVTYLEKAKDRFSIRYLETIKTHFQGYMEVMNAGKTMESVLDTKLKLKVTQAGSKKDVDCFSAGAKDLMYLCMRFALVDSLCEEGGFILLDDPFVNLDKDKIEQGLLFLQKLSKKYQILYFTCHESRGL